MAPLASLGRPRRRLMTVLVALALALLSLANHGAAARAAEPVTITNYTSKSQEMEWGYRSHWKQPWRSYMETVPAQTLLGAIGINFNVPAGWAASTARLLGSSGFSRARIEIGWNSVDYADPTKLTAAKQQSMRTTLTALRENGIRPLILLNANSGEPCPVKNGTVTLTAAASASTRELHIAAADVSKVVAGRTGISDGGIAARYLFQSVAADGTVQLSRPLGKSLPAGTLQVTTLRYEPFRAESLKNGSPNPAFEETMQGWLAYVGAVTRETKAILGSDQFDVEVWNELGFGSDFLSINNYYSPSLEEGRRENEKAILARTIQYIRTPANGLPDVGIGNGFSNERPWEAGSTSPVGLTAIDKHPYKGWVRYPESGETNGNRPLNGLGQLASATKDSQGTWHESFVPTYDAFFPEYWLTGIQTETLVRDLSPTPSFIYDTEHGRTTHPAGGSAPQVWLTEVNLDPTTGPAGGLSARDLEHIKAKNTLRYITSFVNKGVTNIDLYAANDGNYSLVNQGFFSALGSSPNSYPGDAKGGATTDAVRRLTAAMKGAAPISSPRSLSLRSLTDYEGKVQFNGDGTSAYPPLYDRDVLAFLPFQVNTSRFVVPVYVMTRNVEKAYASGSDPSRFDLPPERYRMTIGGVHGAEARVTASDPLSGETVPVEVVARGADQVTVEMRVTDSPRLLEIEDDQQAGAPAPEGGGQQEPPVSEGGQNPAPQEPTPTQPTPSQPSEEAPAPPAAGSGTSQPISSPAPAPPAQSPSPKPRTKPKWHKHQAPSVRIKGGRSVLQKKRLQLVARCQSECRLQVSGALEVDGRTYRLASYPSGAVASSGPKNLTIQLRLDSRTARLGRLAAENGSAVKAVATVQADDGSGSGAPTTRTLAVQVG